MGSLGWVQGLVFGAAPGIENPFSADPLPCVGLGLLPAAVNLVERELTLVAARKQSSNRILGNKEILFLEPGIPLPPALHPPKTISHLFIAPLTENKTLR